jgi:hypothetical protein
MEKSLEAITKRLKQAGLRVNYEKTVICHFPEYDTAPIKIKFNNTLIEF